MPSALTYASYLTQPNVKAWLDLLAWAEGANYNTLYGGGTFSGNQHPNRAVTAGGYTSTAAGRYQFLYSTWIGIKNKLGLADFSPANQDIAALELVSQRGALSYVLNGDLVGALQALGRSGCAWASLPYSGCGQREKSLNSVTAYYNQHKTMYGGNTQTQPTNIYDAGNLATVTVNASDEDNSGLFLVLGLLAIGLLL